MARRTAILKLAAIIAIGAVAGCAPAASVSPAARSFAPPVSTPLAVPPAEPAGDGTTATLSTELGDIVVELFNESSPVAAENFVDLAEAGYYDGVIFHRVIPGFVIQGGDPTGSGSGGPGYTIRDEPVVGDYERGILAMARPANRDGSPIPDSAGSQFFIILDDLRQQLPEDGRYQIFGRVASGMEVVDGIAAGATDPSTDRPLDPVAINSVAIDRP